MAHVMQELCDYEKRRLENIKNNIEIMKTLGKNYYKVNKSDKDYV